MRLPIAKDGLFLIKMFLIFTIGGYVLGYLSRYFYIAACFFLICTLFTAYFFRNPERNIAVSGDFLLSPADGTVFEVVTEGDNVTVKIFMSVLNVHVQRAPARGRIEKIEYKPGKFLHAMDKKADAENEQNLITIRGDKYSLQVKQIAGIIARRIVSWVKEGDSVERGQRIGMIRFGSQVDLILPKGTEINVGKGDKVKAGITVIGKL